MHIECVGGAGGIVTGVVQHCHHDVVAAVPLKRLHQRHIDPVVGTSIVQIERAVIHEGHISNGHPIGTVGKGTLARIGKIDFHLTELGRGIYILERNAVDLAIDTAYLTGGIELLAVRMSIVG